MKAPSQTPPGTGTPTPSLIAARCSSNSRSAAAHLKPQDVAYRFLHGIHHLLRWRFSIKY
jgi:hypothetical protein